MLSMPVAIDTEVIAGHKESEYISFYGYVQSCTPIGDGNYALVIRDLTYHSITTVTTEHYDIFPRG